MLIIYVDSNALWNYNSTIDILVVLGRVREWSRWVGAGVTMPWSREFVKHFFVSKCLPSMRNINNKISTFTAHFILTVRIWKTLYKTTFHWESNSKMMMFRCFKGFIRRAYSSFGCVFHNEVLFCFFAISIKYMKNVERRWRIACAF